MYLVLRFPLINNGFLAQGTYSESAIDTVVNRFTHSTTFSITVLFYNTMLVLNSI